MSRSLSLFLISYFVITSPSVQPLRTSSLFKEQWNKEEGERIQVLHAAFNQCPGAKKLTAARIRRELPRDVQRLIGEFFSPPTFNEYESLDLILYAERKINNKKLIVGDVALYKPYCDFERKQHSAVDASEIFWQWHEFYFTVRSLPYACGNYYPRYLKNGSVKWKPYVVPGGKTEYGKGFPPSIKILRIIRELTPAQRGHIHNVTAWVLEQVEKKNVRFTLFLPPQMKILYTVQPHEKEIHEELYKSLEDKVEQEQNTKLPLSNKKKYIMAAAGTIALGGLIKCADLLKKII